MRLRKLLCGLLVASTLIFSVQPVHASNIDFGDEPELIKGYATAYCLKGKTKSGEEVRDGICSGCNAYYGKTILIYQRLPGDKVGELIGIYECLDTGATKGIKNGTVIDVWCEDLDACQEYMNLLYEDNCKGKVFIQVTDAVG